MKAAKRKDIHCPSQINTEDYDFLGCIYIGPDPFAQMTFADERREIWDIIERNGWSYSKHTHGGTCQVCGASAHYLGVFVHISNGKIIHAGQECSDKIIENKQEEFNALKVRAAAARERGRKLVKARQWSVENGLSAMECVSKTDHVVRDMWSKLNEYGGLSEKQVEYAKKLIDAVKNPIEKEEEPLPTKTAPNGRFVVVGDVLCEKIQDDFYGISTKLLIRSDDGGWKLWVTKPMSLMCENVRGKKISMSVTMTQSDKDEYFAFGKRPTQAKIIGE